MAFKTAYVKKKGTVKKLKKKKETASHFIK